MQFCVGMLHSRIDKSLALSRVGDQEVIMTVSIRMKICFLYTGVPFTNIVKYGTLDNCMCRRHRVVSVPHKVMVAKLTGNWQI